MMALLIFLERLAFTSDRGGHAQHQPDCAEAAQHAAN